MFLILVLCVSKFTNINALWCENLIVPDPDYEGKMRDTRWHADKCPCGEFDLNLYSCCVTNQNCTYSTKNDKSCLNGTLKFPIESCNGFCIGRK